MDPPGTLVDHRADRGALLGEQGENLSQPVRSRARRVERSGGVAASLGDEGRDPTQRLGLVALALGLDSGALVPLVDAARRSWALIGSISASTFLERAIERLLGDAVVLSARSRVATARPRVSTP